MNFLINMILLNRKYVNSKKYHHYHYYLNLNNQLNELLKIWFVYLNNCD